MARVAIIGLGPVGLATTVFFAENGHHVVGLDVDADRVSAIARGEVPFFEKGLAEALRKALAGGRLQVTHQIAEALPQADFIFICVGTPSRPDGSMDDSFIRAATEGVATALSEDGEPIIAVKSTVVPGTTEVLVGSLLKASEKPFALAVNPEFLREGHALEDTFHPDRIILGVDGPDTAAHLRTLYADLDCPILETDLRTAEAIKYATNAFLATKVAFANELANLCQVLDVSYDKIIDGVTLDPRINSRFLVPGVGFGGSCFPKDLRALVAASAKEGYDPPLAQAVLAQNEVQYLQAVRLLEEELGDLRGLRIALLGLAFKANTDDVRESRAIPIAGTLLERGVTVVGYDPMANENFHRVMPDVLLVSSLREALREADGCILQAEWPEFSRLNSEDFLKAMRTPVVVDGRRILEPAKMRGVRFRRIG